MYTAVQAVCSWFQNKTKKSPVAVAKTDMFVRTAAPAGRLGYCTGRYRASESRAVVSKEQSRKFVYPRKRADVLWQQAHNTAYVQQ